MKTIVALEGVDIIKKNYQQVIIRGDGKEEFNQFINKEISMTPPANNLEVVTDANHLFAKQSIDQWSLIYLVEKKHKDILKFISNINSKDEILASDYSYGQIYFEVTGENRNEFLNKLTHFDFRDKKFPEFSMAQTLIARINCSIYNLKNKYIITCNRSFEDYFKERLQDTAKIN
jgi:heterotetrameric sarcosine oxidase gamma subunit